MLFVQFAFLG